MPSPNRDFLSNPGLSPVQLLRWGLTPFASCSWSSAPRASYPAARPPELWKSIPFPLWASATKGWTSTGRTSLCSVRTASLWCFALSGTAPLAPQSSGLGHFRRLSPLRETPCNVYAPLGLVPNDCWSRGFVPRATFPLPWPLEANIPVLPQPWLQPQCQNGLSHCGPRPCSTFVLDYISATMTYMT
jgi:hypothetical protein